MWNTCYTKHLIHTASHTQLKKKHYKITLILTSYKIHCIKLKKEKLLWLQIGFIAHCWIAKHHARWTVVLAHWWFVQAHRSSCVAANLFPGERRRAVSFPLSVDDKFNKNEKSQGSSKLERLFGTCPLLFKSLQTRNRIPDIPLTVCHPGESFNLSVCCPHLWTVASGSCPTYVGVVGLSGTAVSQTLLKNIKHFTWVCFDLFHSPYLVRICLHSSSFGTVSDSPLIGSVPLLSRQCRIWYFPGGLSHD